MPDRISGTSTRSEHGDSKPDLRKRSEDTAPQQGEEEISFRWIAPLAFIAVLIVAITSAATQGSGAAGTPVPSAVAEHPPLRATAPERCKSARKAVPYYRFWTHLHQTARQASRLASQSPVVRGKSCHWARYAAQEWQARASAARRSYERWVEEHTLKDFAWGSGNPWPNAVREVQRIFPGTESWQLSCSDAEGWEPGSHVWIGFGGQPYSTWLRDSDTVGGPMQYRFSTFTGQFRRGLEFVLAEGFRVPRHLRRDMTTAWRSALGQAIASGWARYTGNDNEHWIASWSNGCR